MIVVSMGARYVEYVETPRCSLWTTAVYVSNSPSHVQ